VPYPLPPAAPNAAGGFFTANSELFCPDSKALIQTSRLPPRFPVLGSARRACAYADFIDFQGNLAGGCHPRPKRCVTRHFGPPPPMPGDRLRGTGIPLSSTNSSNATAPSSRRTTQPPSAQMRHTESPISPQHSQTKPFTVAKRIPRHSPRCVTVLRRPIFTAFFAIRWRRALRRIAPVASLRCKLHNRPHRHR
jgi:hypothetical protein